MNVVNCVILHLLYSEDDYVMRWLSAVTPTSLVRQITFTEAPNVFGFEIQ